ncbi:PON3 isoform 4 [Pan troglodytes]|uniref:Paraoxonase 3 n=2 Tax=Homininae TaxID=207598 RepID=F2Z2L3_HUMAN|nr:PON3 isoform 3 [Pan troglodytes]PNI42120.1 PON3 isoform 4 [Pan troglodytes]
MGKLVALVLLGVGLSLVGEMFLAFRVGFYLLQRKGECLSRSGASRT